MLPGEIISHCAVIGNPIAHSLSPVIHQHFARQAGLLLLYEKIKGDAQQVEAQIERFFTHGGKGLNITLPFKQRAFAMAADASSRAMRAKSANTLWMHSGKLHADNTDGIGLIRDLNHHLDLAGKTILLLGAGGAARGVLGPLLDAPIASLTVVNRTMEKARALVREFPGLCCVSLTELDSGFDVIINATSASLTASEDDLPPSFFEGTPFCYDLTYNAKAPTSFVAAARRHQCEAVDGLGMLVEQAAESFFIWHGFKPLTAAVLKFLREK